MPVPSIVHLGKSFPGFLFRVKDFGCKGRFIHEEGGVRSTTRDDEGVPLEGAIRVTYPGSLHVGHSHTVNQPVLWIVAELVILLRVLSLLASSSNV